MFDTLSDGFNGVFRKLSGKGSISESNVREAMEEVKTALLEADVNYDVVQQFTKDVLADAVGREVTKSLKPGQEMIGIVNRRLIELLGGDPDAGPEAAMDAGPGIMKVSPGPTVVMMCGLQGSGKTTTCGKLAGYLKKRGRSVMLAAADLQRPAAVEINAHWMRLDLRDTHVRAAVEAGAKIAIDCDDHAPADFDNLRYGVLTGRRGWLTPDLCVNTWTKAKLRTWLKSKGRS